MAPRVRLGGNLRHAAEDEKANAKDLQPIFLRHKRMGQLVKQYGGKEQYGSHNAHGPVLRCREVTLRGRKNAFGHGIDHQKENDEPRVVNDYLDPADTDQVEAT